MRAAALLVALLVATGAQAQETPIRDRSLHPWPYVALVAGNVLDVYSTERQIARGCVEANPLYGSRVPSLGRIVAVKAAVLVPLSVALAQLQRGGHQTAAARLGWVAGALGGGVGVRNLTINCR